MPEQIGKYHVLERIGRGGMGMVFKAHDPVLDRPVALKVISSEVDVTDELRTRFFREAQACARLSHPNIVTIYDMGEQDGRLYIVMELLDGDELRHLITRRIPLPLEDKLSVIAQICDGLHYAHQKGIVHRDIKPGNIFLLRNGQVKILDFGIAQMATTEAGLTRTGLIMGTLRYIAPEQVRGRADARSDIYSVGAVCYELLGLRSPFTGDDPLHILEQLRSEEPTPLHSIDASLPGDVVAVVERAMRKDPGERYSDLAQMRAEIDLVQRGIREEAHRLRAQLREQLDEIFHLQHALAESIGTVPDEPALPIIDEQGRLAAMQAIGLDFAARRAALRDKLAQAEALAPSLRRGNELLQALQFADAALEFEAILSEMPEHARARQALRQAQAQAGEQRRQQLASALLHDAQAAFDDGSYALCLEILKQAAAVPPHGGIVQDMASLRQTAEVAFEAQEATRRERERADREREKMARARRDARQQDATHYVPDSWNEAEAGAGVAESLYTQEAYGPAGQAFERAVTAYHEAAAAARDAHVRERQATEQARDRMTRLHEEALAGGALEHARELWEAAEAKSVEAHGAMGAGSLARAISAFDDASLLYRQASAAATQHRDRQQADREREKMARARQDAQAHGAAHYAPDPWNKAEAFAGDAQREYGQQEYARARQEFESAASAYHEAEVAARQAQARERDAAEQARAQMDRHQHEAHSAGALEYARVRWDAAGAKASEAQGAFEAGLFAQATEAFDEASLLYRQTIEAATLERNRQKSAEAREQAMRSRQAASAVGVGPDALLFWKEAEAKLSQGDAALQQESFGDAIQMLAAAAALYRQAESEAVEIRQRQRSQAEQARRAMRESRDKASAVEAASRAQPTWAQAENTSALAEDAFTGESYLGAIQTFEKASDLYRQAAEIARDTARRREKERLDAEQAREAASQARRAAAETHASRYAAKPWTEAETAEERARAALSRLEFAAARSHFIEARRLYATAAQAAGIAADLMTRRVDAIMSEAQRLLESKDPASCLRRVNEVLTIKPGHAPAEALGHQAEAMLRELERVRGQAGAAETTLSFDSQTKHSNALDTEGEPTELIDTAPAANRPRAPETVSTGATPPRAQAPDVGDTNEDVDATIFALPRARAPQRVPESPSTGRAALDGVPDVVPVTRRTPRRFGARAVLVALGVLLVIIAALLYLRAHWDNADEPPRRTFPVQPRSEGPQRPSATEVETVRALREKVMAAREEANKADAERWAPGAFSAATAKEREGEAALNAQNTSSAQQRYQEALDGFTRAKADSERAASINQIDVASRLLIARKDAAEKAGAPKLALPLWAKANTAQKAAEEARKQPELGRAVALLTEASERFEEAERAASSAADRERTAALQRQQAETDRQTAVQRQQAETDRQAALQRQQVETDRQAALQRQQAETERQAAVERQRAEAERTRLAALEQQRTEAGQARERVAVARRAAEQADASRYAQKLFAAAQTKERDAAAVLGRPDPGTAARLFREAETDYRAAQSEADTEQRRVVALKSTLDQSLSRMLERREQAVKAEAERLAKDTFAAAQAKQGEADGLARRQELVAATQVYQDATERYLEASTRALGARQARTQADSAKVQMLIQKVRANQRAPDFRAGLDEESSGDSLYDRSVFGEAAEKFRSAEKLFVKAQKSAPPPPPF